MRIRVDSSGNFNHRNLGIFLRNENMSNKIGTCMDYLNQEIVNKNITC